MYGCLGVILSVGRLNELLVGVVAFEVVGLVVNLLDILVISARILDTLVFRSSVAPLLNSSSWGWDNNSPNWLPTVSITPNRLFSSVGS